MKPRRSMTRTSGIRDASIITIACEGLNTESASYTFPSRVHAAIPEREDPTLSAPEHIILMIDKDLNNAYDYIDHIDSAIDNAQLLDTSLNDRWPQSFGSRVYLLCKEIMKQSRSL